MEYIERRILASLFATLKREGYSLICTDTGPGDGDDQYETITTVKGTLDNIESTGQATVTVEKNGRRYGILCILGNGQDVISDYSAPRDDVDGFSNLMDQTVDVLVARYGE